jgi:CRP-like cAMP-binding protein
VKGEVEICHKNTVIKVLEEGDIFGSIEFFTGYEYKESARSNDFTTLLEIKRGDFLNLLLEFKSEDPL